jgi:asparagine synthase (glutamine-hydrolysing)
LSKNAGSISRAHGDWRKAFSCSLPGTDLDESAAAREVASYVGGSVELIAPDFPDLSEWVVNTTRRLDFVYVTPQIMAQTYGAMKNHGFTVSLDGHGVDEMAYGYGHLVSLALADARVSGNTNRAADLKNIYDSMTPAWSQEMDLKDRLEGSKSVPTISKLRSYVSSGIKYRSNQLIGWPHLKSNKNPWLRMESSFMEGALLPAAPRDLTKADKTLFHEFHQKTLPTLLRNYDRVAMLSGVEIRMPFMDWRIVTLLFALPQEFKLGQNFTKKILRDSVKGMLPDSIRLNRVKTGWNAPMVDWFNGPLQTLILDTVNSKSFLQSSVWDGRLIQKFALENCNNQSWTWAKCCRFWPFLNAHLLAEVHGIE